MNIGKLDQEINLYSHASSNNFGDVQDDYTLVGMVWGRVMSQSGSEAF